MKILKYIWIVFCIHYNLWATSHCLPSNMDEHDFAKSLIEYSLSGGDNFYMQEKNICLMQSAFPYILISEIEEGEINDGDPEYFVQSKHNFTITSLKKIKREMGWDYYEVVFTVDAVKEKRNVKLDITLNYSIDLNSYTDFSRGCLYTLESDHPHVVYQECYDSVQAYHKEQAESER